jgi:hypothetical protein
MQNHGVQKVNHVSRLHNIISALVVQTDLRKQSRDIQAQLFACVELRVEEDVAESDNSALGNLRMTLLDVRQVPERTCNLHKNHRFLGSSAAEHHDLLNRHCKQRHHLVVNRLRLYLLVALCEAFDRPNGIVEQVQDFLVVFDQLAGN